MTKEKNPKAYTAPHDVYLDKVFTKAGDVFVTDEEPADSWVEHTPEEAHIIDASTRQFPADPPLEDLDMAALKAMAVTKNINTVGMTKKQLIDAIKAWNDPTR
jgi:hypothetical protein